MINSLSKDSHITQSLWYSKKVPNSGRDKSDLKGLNEKTGARKNEIRKYSSATTNNKTGINIRKPAEINFSGLSSANKVSKIYTNKTFNWLLEQANAYQTIFAAGFAILLTCFLRPATIMALPSDKKNIDDKKYASAQSIASGIIGFIISLAIAKPIGDAVKKVLAEPDKYIKNKANYFKNDVFKKTANTYLGQAPDIIMAAPKAIITIAIIPPILKYVFGLEKKKGDKKFNNIDFSALNFNSASLPTRRTFRNFNGGNK